MKRITLTDVATPANAITIAGLAITTWGACILYAPIGLLLVLVGRSFDLIDGPVARATRRTEFSVFLDPAADKLALLAIVVAVFGYQLAPWWVVAYILLQNVITTVISVMAERRGNAVGALLPGKLNLFCQQVALLLFIFASTVSSGLTDDATIIAYGSFGISVPLGILSIRTYAQQLATQTDRLQINNK